MNQILVASNCQTAGLTIGLRMLFPDTSVLPIPYPEFPLDSKKFEELASSLSNSDTVVSTAPTQWNEALTSNTKKAQIRLVTAPEIYFDAFHPDLVYAFDSDTQTLMSPAGPYNSAIVLWAWINKLSTAHTESLFNDDVMKKLGYLDRWHSAYSRLNEIFTDHEMETSSFIMPIQRIPVFMHTVNHPRKEALAQLARLIAKKIDPTNSFVEEPIEDFMADGLLSASTVWPVYPAIAAELGVRGSYLWKTPEGKYLRLSEFIEQSFQMYDTQKTHTFKCDQLSWPNYSNLFKN